MPVLGLRCCEGFSLAVVSGGYSLLWYVGFSLQWLLLLGSMDSLCMQISIVVVPELGNCGSWALDHRLSGCDT